MKPKIIKPNFINPFLQPHKDKRITKEDVDNAILNRAKTHKQIVHGSTALHAQIGEYAREPHDIDILTNSPRHHMDKMENRLDEMAGRDAFGEVILPIIGTEGEYVYKVVKKTYGPDIDVVDYFNMKKGVKTKTIKGVRYAHWQYAKKRLQQIVADPQKRHRHMKARGDLRRIEAYERSLRK